MSISEKYALYLDSQNPAIDRSSSYFNHRINQATWAGHIQFCENPYTLRKTLLKQKRNEGLNNNGEEGQKNSHPHYKVLVVDDEELMRELIVTLLSEQGHQCITAGNGVEALNKMKRNKVDAVITDIVMPEMDGITLTKEILSLYPYLPIMVITGHSKEYSAEDALAVGARDFIEKPFSIEEFLLRLSKMMRDYEILCQLKVKQNQMVFRLSKKSLEETNDLRREIESLKSRLCSVYNGSF